MIRLYPYNDMIWTNIQHWKMNEISVRVFSLEDELRLTFHVFQIP